MFQPIGVQPGQRLGNALWQRDVFAGCLALGLALLVGVSGYAQVQRTEGTQESKWEVFSGCRLVTNQIVDGDSFHVLHKGREYIFRLYFVDSPESDPTLKDRIKEQAVYFGISPDQIPRAGALASRFTREKLTGRDITVIHRWQNAMGRSSLARYYAVVMVDGRSLAEELVANGLARIYGPRANWPDGPKSTLFLNQLKNLEITAREKNVGVHDRAAFPLETDAAASSVSTNTPASNASAELIDLNSASFEELIRLPGIGPKLAERIMAHRPYQTLKDFDAVPGIGPATLEQLRPLVRVNQSAASGSRSN
jgi:competence protein ComEA